MERISELALLTVYTSTPLTYIIRHQKKLQLGLRLSCSHLLCRVCIYFTHEWHVIQLTFASEWQFFFRSFCQFLFILNVFLRNLLRASHIFFIFRFWKCLPRWDVWTQASCLISQQTTYNTKVTYSRSPRTSSSNSRIYRYWCLKSLAYASFGDLWVSSKVCKLVLPNV